MSWTKEKQREYFKKYAEANRERLKRYKSEWWDKNKDRMSELSHQRYLNNIDERRKYRKRQYAANREDNIRATIEWQNGHPERTRIYIRLQQHRRRCKGSISVYLFDSMHEENIKKHGQLTCEICKKPMESNVSIDHILPIKRGGDNSKENLQLAHRSCNSRKGNKTMEELLHEHIN